MRLRIPIKLNARTGANDWSKNKDLENGNQSAAKSIGIIQLKSFMPYPVLIKAD